MTSRPAAGGAMRTRWRSQPATPPVGRRSGWCSRRSWPRAGYIVFYTSYGSRKAADLEQTGRAAAALYWEEIGRQVRFEGRSRAIATCRERCLLRQPALAQPTERVGEPPERAARRPGGARAARRAESPRGRRAASRARTASSLPRPKYWGGYRLWFDALELWAEGADRFHERLRYTRGLTPLDEFAFRGGPLVRRNTCNLSGGPNGIAAARIDHVPRTAGRRSRSRSTCRSTSSVMSKTARYAAARS